MRSLDTRVVEITTPTSTGTQDYTVPGIGGTPSGALFVVTQVTSLGVQIASLNFSWGVTDGTNHFCRVWASRSGAATTVTGSSGSTDVIRILDINTLGEALVGEFDSFITDGIRVNYTTAPVVALKGYVILFFGTDIQCGAFYADPPVTVNTSVAVNVGFEPDVVLTASAKGTNDELLKPDADGVFGIATNSSPITNAEAGFQTRNNVSISVTNREAFNDRVNQLVRYTPGLTAAGRTTIESYTSTGFSVFTRGLNDAQDIIGLAIKLPTGSSFFFDDFLFNPGSTGPSTRSGLGVRPGLMYRTASTVASFNVRQTNASFALGVCDYTLNQYCLTVFDENGVALTNSGNTLAGVYHEIDDHAGTLVERGQITDISDGEYTINMLTATVARERFHELILPEIPFDGSVTAQLPSMNADLVAELQLDSEIDVVLPSAAVEVVANIQPDAVVEVTLPSQAVDVVAEIQLDSTIEFSLPVQSVDLVAELQLDADISVALPSQSVDVVAEIQLDGSIDVALPSQSADLVVNLQLDSSLNVELPRQSADIETELQLDADISVTLPGQSAELVSEIQLDGSIDVTFPSQLVDIEADIVSAANDADIVVQLPRQNADLTAELVLDSSIDVTLPSHSAEVIAELRLDSEISVTLPGQASDLVAELVLDASVDVSFSSMNADLEAIADYIGTIGVSLPAQFVDAEAEVFGALGAVIEVSLPAAATVLEVELQYDAAIGVTFPSIAVQIIDAPLLGCDTELQASIGPRTALLGSSDVRTALVGSSNIVVELDASSNIIVNLSASSDTIAGLGGSTC